jgi:multiple antibiotic resistance protein
MLVQFIEVFTLSFFAFFGTLSPINCLVIFMSMTGNYTSEERKKMAIKAVSTSAGILIFLMFFGITVLQFMGISMPALRTAGGLLLLLTAIGMVFGHDKEAPDDVGVSKKDITVFPLAVPIIAGPAAITTAMLFIQKYSGTYVLQSSVFLALLLNLIITMVLLLLSDKILARIKKSFIEVVLRIIGLILASLAIQFIFDGLKESGIFK